MERKPYPIHIRFNDLDSYGHVNNAVYLTYFEEGRKYYFQDKVGNDWDWQKHGILLAHHEIDYKVPLLLTDDARIEVWVSKFGQKSFDVSYRIVKKQDDNWVLCTTGKSVAVCFDYEDRATIPVPDKWKELFQLETS